jgi:hypothetical protein
MNSLCPVCGYDLKEPAADSLICVCCGTQYGYHDSTASHSELRERWMSGGAKWHSRRILPPPDWSLVNQLRSIGCEVILVNREQLEVVV